MTFQITPDMLAKLKNKPAQAEPSKPMAGSLALLKGIKPSTEIAETPPLVVIANRIRTRLETSAIEIGKDLLAAKELLSHGEWQPWLKSNFDWSPSQAKRFMDIAKDPKSTNLAILPFVAQAALAAPSTPEAVKDEVIADLAAGKKPSLKEVQAKITIAKKYGMPVKAKSDAANPQQPVSAQKHAPVVMFKMLDTAPDEEQAEQAQGRIVKWIHSRLDPKDLDKFATWCALAGWGDLGERLMGAPHG